MTVTDDLFTDYCIKIDGILGNEILKLGFVYFDNKNKVIKISNSINSFNLNLNTFFKVRNSRLVGNIHIKMNKKKYLIDTGYNGFIMTKYDSIKLEKINSKSILNSSFKGIHSSENLAATYYVDEVMLNKQTYQGLFTATPGINENILGIKWFLSNNVIFDISSNSLYLEKINLDVNQAEKIKIKKVGFIYREKQVVINVIQNNISSLKLNDVVLKINDLSFDGINSMCELDEKLKTIDFKKKHKAYDSKRKRCF